MHDLDHVGHCVLRPGASDQIVLPLLWGSSHPNDRGFQIPRLASNVYGPVNAVQRVRLPVFLLRCRCYGSWFNAPTLQQFFARNLGDGQLVGRSGNGSLGSIQWRYANETPVQYAACKVAQFSLLWNGAGAPIEAQMAIVAYGYRMTPNFGFRFGAYVGPGFHGQGLTHGALSGVWNGQLTINNNLTPNLSSPHYNSIDGDLYPVDYANDSISVVCDLEQAAGAALTVDSLFSDGLGGFTLRFQDRTRTQTVNARLSVLAPAVTTQTVRLANGRVARRYCAIKPNAVAPMLSIF